MLLIQPYGSMKFSAPRCVRLWRVKYLKDNRRSRGLIGYMRLPHPLLSCESKKGIRNDPPSHFVLWRAGKPCHQDGRANRLSGNFRILSSANGALKNGGAYSVKVRVYLPKSEPAAPALRRVVIQSTRPL